MTPSPLARVALALLGAVDLARGAIHVALPDSGAGVIAGLDLTQGGPSIVLLLATLGVSQIAFGLIEVAAAWRFPALVVPLLALALARTLATVWLLKVYKPLPVDVPGEAGAVAAAAVLAAVLAVEFFGSRRAVR